MQFTTTVIAAALAITAAAMPQRGVPANPVFDQPFCPQIADRPQSILMEDVWKAYREAVELAHKVGDKYPCSGPPNKGDFIYGGGGTVLVKTTAANGKPHCIHPWDVATAIQKMIPKCSNEWGYLDIARISFIDPRDKSRKVVKLEEMANDKPRAVGK